MKEHKKLYKSGKNWMTATLVTATLAGGVLLGTDANVHADTTATQTQQDQNTQKLAALRQDAAKQQSTIDNARGQQTQQQNELIDAQNKKSSAQQMLNEAKQSQSNFIKNDSSVKQAQDAYNSAADSQQQAQTQLNNDLDAQQQAQQQNAQTVEQQKQQAQQTINNIEQKQADQKIQDVQNQEQNTQSELDQATQNVNNTNSQIDNLNQQKTDLQNQSGTSVDPNVVAVPNGSIDYSKSLLENAARNSLFTSPDLNIGNNNIIPSNIYITPDDNKSQPIPSLNNSGDATQSQYDPYFTTKFDGVRGQMTDAQKQELAILLMNEINHAREQRGLQPFTMSEQKYQQAQVRANQDSARTLTHSVPDMISAFGADQYENLAYIDAHGGSNMLSLLYNASSTLSNMLNADASSDWGHRENFLESGQWDAAFGFRYLPDSDMYVMTFDFDNAKTNNTPDMMDRIGQYEAMGPISDATTVDNSAQINDLNNQIQSLRLQASLQQNKVQNLQNKLNQLKQEEQNARDNFAFDASQLSSDDLSSYNSAQDMLNNADSYLANLNNSEAMQELANSVHADRIRLANAKAATEDAQNKLDEAKTNANTQAAKLVQDAQKELDAANKKVQDLSDSLDVINQTIQDAQNKLQKDQQQISELESSHATNPSNPVHHTDAELNTNLDVNAIKPVTVVEGTTNIHNPEIKSDYVSTTTTPSSVALLALVEEANHVTYPAGTKAMWADSAKIVSDAQHSNTYDEGVYLVFPDGSHSAVFTVPASLVVTPKQSSDQGSTSTPVVPDTPTDETTKHDDSTTPVVPETPTDETTKHDDSITPVVPEAPTDETTKHDDSTIPVVPDTSTDETAEHDGSTEPVISETPVNNHADSKNLSDFAAHNDVRVQKATVTMTREEYKAQQTNENKNATLPQTGSKNELLIVGLGALTAMLGLGLTKKKQF